MTEHEIEEMRRIHEIDKKIIHYIVTIAVSALVSILTTIALVLYLAKSAGM